METKTIEHRGSYDSENPVLIFSKRSIGDDRKSITGAALVNGERLNVGDIISSSYIGSNATYNSNYTSWEVMSVERFTPEGWYVVDKFNIGFYAVVEPFES